MLELVSQNGVEAITPGPSGSDVDKEHLFFVAVGVDEF
jgi:hypothetical protein